MDFENCCLCERNEILDAIEMVSNVAFSSASDSLETFGSFFFICVTSSGLGVGFFGSFGKVNGKVCAVWISGDFH